MNEAAKLFHKVGEGCSPDHSLFPVAEYECLWPHVSCMKAGWSSWPIIFTLAQLMEWPACLVCSDTADLRLQACTDFPCLFSLKCLVSLLFHQCPQHHNPYV